MNAGKPEGKPETIVAVFDNIPGCHKNWSLAVYAVNVNDARQAVKATHRGGKLREVIDTPGQRVHADCGLTTELAASVYRRNLERLMAEE